MLQLEQMSSTSNQRQKHKSRAIFYLENGSGMLALDGRSDTRGELEEIPRGTCMKPLTTAKVPTVLLLLSQRLFSLMQPCLPSEMSTGKGWKCQGEGSSMAAHVATGESDWSLRGNHSVLQSPSIRAMKGTLVIFSLQFCKAKLSTVGPGSHLQLGLTDNQRGWGS